MLFSYSVQIKNIDVGSGVKKYVNYLNSYSHNNHNRTKFKIIGLQDNENGNLEEDFIKLMKYKQNKNKSNYEENGKGGKKLKRIGKSLTFNVPPKYNPSVDNLKDIYKDLVGYLKSLYERNGFILTDKDFYSNIHYQDNSHINMILPTVDLFGNNIRFINSESIFNQIRKQFTLTVDKTLNKDISTYVELTIEQKHNNKYQTFLNSLISGYKLELESGLLDEKEEKYIKNQIVRSERTIKKLLEVSSKPIEEQGSLIEQIRKKDIEQIDLNKEKYLLSRKQKELEDKDITTTVLPTLKR